MEIFVGLGPAASSHSILGFDSFARDYNKICPLVAILQAEIYWALRAKDTGLFSVDTVINVSYPGLTEHRAMHLWCQCLWILIPASVAK